ncbi:mitochondrial fission ELM1 family protein [Halomonas sp. IOP_31]|uniref:mitochondrial fission ELM1 family protein n=1 Tax=Halomonas sp. IOP_31 TaxID=2876584 RepID=UPI001E55F9DC|nr:mitochondrial fission ELM1 family protein [Halomonas sp. IOP_31]MCD6008202.1 mitochondrial fission ELM1 family protein [Halomonas sp. IOP_31]
MTIAARPIRVERADTSHQPHCVILPALTSAPSPRPPVRIFLGTEKAQVRAQRIFFYSVERVRDPAREYRIYLMKDIAGFDQSTWRTGFTNYRFAIPDFAGREGRAIYNDVDQIYFTDPAVLFDLPMAEHGYLAISAKDTSVMVMDCARMAQWWNLDQARQAAKKTLTDTPAEQPGLWGELDGHWNARDEEYEHNRTHVLHYTALHQQPWQPTPRIYSYHPNALGDLWHRLEQEADAQYYGPFSRQAPSPWFEQALQALETPDNADEALRSSRRAAQLASECDAASLLWCRPARQTAPPSPLNLEASQLWHPERDAAVDAAFDGVAVTGVLEHLPAEDIHWFMGELAQRARCLLYVGIQLPDPRRVDDQPFYRTHWWREQLRRISGAYPDLVWHLDIQRTGTGMRECVQSGLSGARQGHGRVPRVWLLLGRHHGDNAQLSLLAQRLGWPSEEKRLNFKPSAPRPALFSRPSLANIDLTQSDRLEPPWPDLILSTGRRSVGAARWVKQQSGGRTQLIFLGRPRAPLDWFDLIITTPQYGLPARDNVIHNLLPLNAPDPAALDQAAADWQARFDDLPRPRIGVLVGGATKTQHFDATVARAMAQAACRLAKARGGSLLITTSPRTPPDAADAFFAGIDVPSYRYAWHHEDGADNPYRAYLALCDAFVVSGDSVSMQAEAIRTKKPVHVFPLALPPTSWSRFGHRFEAFMHGRTQATGTRGTHRQQDWKGRLYDRAFCLGLVPAPRSAERLHNVLAMRNLVEDVRDVSSEASKSTAPRCQRVDVADEVSATVESISERAGEHYWRERR